MAMEGAGRPRHGPAAVRPALPATRMAGVCARLDRDSDKLNMPGRVTPMLRGEGGERRRPGTAGPGRGWRLTVERAGPDDDARLGRADGGWSRGCAGRQGPRNHSATIPLQRSSKNPSEECLLDPRIQRVPISGPRYAGCIGCNRTLPRQAEPSMRLKARLIRTRATRATRRDRRRTGSGLARFKTQDSPPTHTPHPASESELEHIGGSRSGHRRAGPPSSWSCCSRLQLGSALRRSCFPFPSDY